MKTLCKPKCAPGMRRKALPVLIVGASMLLAGCASTPAPTEQLAVSAAAVSRADSAGAATLAPAEMQMAREKLEQARLAMTREDFDNARNLAQEAQVDAQLAEAKSRSGEARKAAGELQEGVRVLRDELDRKNK